MTPARALWISLITYTTVADPDLSITRGGHPDPEIRRAGAVSKFFFRPFGPQFGLRKGRGGEGGRTPPLDPPLHKVVTCINIG